MAKVQQDRASIERRVQELAPWFHNLDLHGVRTAPEQSRLASPNEVEYARMTRAEPFVATRS